MKKRKYQTKRQHFFVNTRMNYRFLRMIIISLGILLLVFGLGILIYFLVLILG
jgi:hypothetical protein